MELAREACRAFGWPAVAAPGFEGDDIIATMAGAAKDRQVAIVASDKDFLQLVSDRVFVVCPTKKVLYASLDVEAKWGVPPRLMADLQSLAGDAADNVKGIPGIGPKTASELLRQFGSLEGILDNAALVKQPKRRASLIAGRASALHARRLVTLKADVPPMSLMPPLQDDAEMAALLAAPTPTDFAAAIAFCKRYELWAVAQNLEKHAK
jgi:DNA polymerase-1